jgi:hypothetical protein
MPSVDRGWVIVEIREVLKVNREARRRLLEGILASKEAILVTLPSIVYVETELTAISVSIGVGSVILKSPENIDVGELNLLRLFRREWVDGCYIGKDPSFSFIERGRKFVLKGVARALTLKDPVALVSNGIKGTHEVLEDASLDGLIPLVKVGDKEVVFRDTEYMYLSTVSGGPLREVLEYIMPLASACIRNR